MNKNLHICLRILAVVLIGLIALPAAFAENPDYGDSCGSAELVNVPSTSNGRIVAGRTGQNSRPPDEDFFKFTLGSTGTLRVYTTGNTDTVGYLLNSYCSQIAFNDDNPSMGGRYNFGIEKMVSAGTYYVRIRGYSFATQGNYAFVIEFDGDQNHTITASATTGGSISPAGVQTVAHNGSMIFTLNAYACYIISDLNVDNVSKGARSSWSFTDVTENHTIEAIFVPEGPFSISASAETGGSIDPAGSVVVTCGEEKEFYIDKDDHYEILDVLVDGVSRGKIDKYKFMDVGESHTIVAKFKEDDKYTITVISGDGGSISPEGTLAVYQHSNQAFSIDPLNGYLVEEVWINGISQGSISAYTFEDVTSDQRIEATFKVDDSGGSGSGCLNISDTPLDARFQAAPPNIMFLLDDSGSMDWEVMTPSSSGVFEDRYYYVFDDPGDHIYYPGNDYYILKGEERKKWKAQWSGHNHMYYNPQVTYNPWPNLDDADIKTPRSHPMIAGNTLTLAGAYLTLTGGTVIVDEGDTSYSTSAGWSHYGFFLGANNTDADLSTMIEEDKTATWSPNLPVGSYKVYARWGVWVTNEKVHYKIYGDGSDMDEDKEMDQCINGSQWNLLGTYTFTPSGFVRLEFDKGKAKDHTAVADAIKFEPVDDIQISNAHYYTWNDADADGEMDSNETLYLVNFLDADHDGTIDTRQWYEVRDDGDDIIQLSELWPISESGVPSEVRPKVISEDLQNFANWYSFYRRRELSATAAVANVIDQANRMQIGIYSINGLINEPVHKINVDGTDERDSLLEKLYAITLSAQGTPLRRGLQSVGKYFDKTDGGDTGGIGNAPWFTSADGGACQQAFAIVMTDGYYNGGEPWNPAKNYDGDNGEPYADSWTNTLADIAMYYYENDLVPDNDLTDLVPTNGRDLVTHQHLVTYGVGFGVTGTLSPDNYDDTLKHKTTGSYVQWPNPSSADKAKIDDLWHASVNGRGRFLTSGDAEELLNDLLLVFKDIEYFAGSASSVSVNGDELYTRINDHTMLFQAKYYSENWHGDVLAYRVNPTSGELELPAVWSAAKQLSLKSAGNRLIATSNGRGWNGSDNNCAGLKFRYSGDNSITNTMKKLLDSDDAIASQILDYLRGEPANEVVNGGSFRNRTWRIRDPHHPLNGQSIISSKLMDVVHSSPVYRNGTLYSGGNDGMLHAFDASTGEELFAYVPYLVAANLKYLVDPDYGHKYYVDLTPVVASVELGTITDILVGGLGKGGKGYFALDISGVDPTQNKVPRNENKVREMVMWEWPNSDTDPDHLKDMGYSFSRVTIAKSHDVSNLKDMVIFGNGYNSDNGSAVLMILDPADGKLIRKIDTGVTGCNGLSTPIAVDVDFDDIVDYVYAGDLRGNLWKFDLTDPDASNWDVAYSESSVPKPLFKTSGATVQPITTRPDVMFHCSQNGYMVFFGTGKYLEDADLTNTDPQSIYAIWDFGDDDDNSEYAGDWNFSALSNPNLLSSTSLEQQGFTQYPLAGAYARVTTANNPDWTPTTLDSGGQCGAGDGVAKCDRSSPGAWAEPVADVAWYMNLDSGERIVSDLMVRDGKLLIVSYVPAGSMCGTGGKSWLMAVNACTGAHPSDALFDIDQDGDVDTDDVVKIQATGQEVVPNGLRFEGRLQPPAIILFGKTEVLYMSSSNGDIVRTRQKSARLGMVYWRIFRPTN